jgi:kynurenine formamidase
MKRVGKLSRALGVQSQFSKVMKCVRDVDAPAHAQQNGVKHDSFTFQLFVTKIFGFLLSGFKLMTWSSVFTIFDFHQVDQAIILRDIFWRSSSSRGRGVSI